MSYGKKVLAIFFLKNILRSEIFTTGHKPIYAPQLWRVCLPTSTHYLGVVQNTENQWNAVVSQTVGCGLVYLLQHTQYGMFFWEMKEQECLYTAVIVIFYWSQTSRSPSHSCTVAKTSIHIIIICTHTHTQTYQYIMLQYIELYTLHY